MPEIGAPKTLERLGGVASMQNSVRLDMDLRHNPGMDTDHHQRRLLVLRPWTWTKTGPGVA